MIPHEKTRDPYLGSGTSSGAMATEASLDHSVKRIRSQCKGIISVADHTSPEDRLRIMPAITVRGAGVETKGDRLVAVFTLSEPPDPQWIVFFRERARYSVFDAAAATFHRNRLRMLLPRREDLEQLTPSVERFIDGANLDVELHRAS